LSIPKACDRSCVVPTITIMYRLFVHLLMFKTEFNFELEQRMRCEQYGIRVCNHPL